MINILEGKLSSAQKDVISIQNGLSKKETKITSLKSKIAELENIKSELKSKVNKLECLKSEDRLDMQVLLFHNTACSVIIGGDEEKNMTKSDDISAVNESSKNLSKYFVCGKSMDQTEKIDGNILTYTNDEITETNSKVSNKTSISEVSKDILSVQEIPNVTPHLIQLDSQITHSAESLIPPIGGIGAIPIVASTLMSRLLAYIFLFC